VALNIVRSHHERFDGRGVPDRLTGEQIPFEARIAAVADSFDASLLPDGSVELLSTHDQLLGGASGQSYLGCVFPADPAYAQTIAANALPQLIHRHRGSARSGPYPGVGKRAIAC
jgi:hypothetical protein